MFSKCVEKGHHQDQPSLLPMLMLSHPCVCLIYRYQFELTEEGVVDATGGLVVVRPPQLGGGGGGGGDFKPDTSSDTRAGATEGTQRYAVCCCLPSVHLLHGILFPCLPPLVFLVQLECRECGEARDGGG